MNSTLVKTGREIAEEGLLRDNNQMANVVMDSLLMKEFGQAMNLKIDEKRNSVDRGWYDTQGISGNALSTIMIDSINSGDWVSVANYAAMLWGRDLIRDGSQ